MHRVLLIVLLGCVSNASAESYYCNSELWFESKTITPEKSAYEVNYVSPRPVTGTSDAAQPEIVSFEVSIGEGELKIFIPDYLDQKFRLRSEGQFLETPYYARSNQGSFFIKHYQFNENRNENGGSVSGVYHDLFIDRVDQKINILVQSWDREQLPHEYITYEIVDANCRSIQVSSAVQKMRNAFASTTEYPDIDTYAISKARLSKYARAIARIENEMNQKISTLNIELKRTKDLLALSEQKDADSQIQLQNLGNRLNAALARAASEERKRRKLKEAERIRLEAEAKKLEEEPNQLADQALDLANYKSEFFSRLRQILVGVENIEVIEDGFRASSEVLFEPGTANLSEAGQLEIDKIANILLGVKNSIPDTIEWVIRVDGHTDNIPLSGAGEFRDNWELSQARALSVVRYMVEAFQFPANRMAANGFGEFQPVNTDDTREARAQNRRIEIKLTER